MTQEDKELLLKDLCARLPYGVMIYDYDREETREMGFGTLHDIMFNDLGCNPYLRPMSSMTQCECTQLYMLLPKSYIVYPEEIHNIDELTKIFPEHIEIITDFYNSHYIDWRGLIPKGLALEAPKDMYNIK